MIHQNLFDALFLALALRRQFLRHGHFLGRVGKLPLPELEAFSKSTVVVTRVFLGASDVVLLGGRVRHVDGQIQI